MIEKIVLDNGAKIITEVVDTVYSASVGMWVDVGSEDETPVTNGVSHCLEHMLFKGTETRCAQDIAHEIEDVGGTLGAATSKENTFFYGQVLGDQLHVALDLLTDMLLHARIDENDLELEREVILEEIKMYEDDPEDLCQELMLLKVWSDHSLGRPITGTHESVTSITRMMLKEHIDRYYRPENFVISIAGNFDRARAVELLTKVLGKLPVGQPKPKLTSPKNEKTVFVKNKDIEQTHVVLATEGLAVNDDKRYASAILDLCLGGNLSSRLFQEVREKRGLVYTINTYKTSHRNTGLFGVYAGTSPKKVKEVLELIMTEFQKVKDEGLTEREIARAKTQLKSDLMLGLESMRNRASRNAYGELFFGRQLSVDELCKDIDNVTGKHIKQLANDILREELLSIVLVGPEKQLPKEYSLVC